MTLQSCCLFWIKKTDTGPYPANMSNIHEQAVKWCNCLEWFCHKSARFGRLIQGKRHETPPPPPFYHLRNTHQTFQDFRPLFRSRRKTYFNFSVPLFQRVPKHATFSTGDDKANNRCHYHCIVNQHNKKRIAKRSPEIKIPPVLTYIYIYICYHPSRYFSHVTCVLNLSA